MPAIESFVIHIQQLQSRAICTQLREWSRPMKKIARKKSARTAQPPQLMIGDLEKKLRPGKWPFPTCNGTYCMP